VPGLFEELEWRGLVHQMTDADLGARLDADRLTFYIGFDPTAPSLHIGNLLQLCNLRRLSEAGHRAIALAGGGTGMIGDPGGRTEERSLLGRDELDANLAGIRPQLERFVDLGAEGAILANNADWLREIGLLEFLRDVGKLFTVNQMVAKEAVRTRFEAREQGISYTEFSYMLLQAYDFLHLFDLHGCRLQLGGSDQWGNITMGVELIRKTRDAQAFGVTSPLVLNPDGSKMGKTAHGETVWLDAGRTSPYRFFQHFVRVDDSAVGPYLRFFTWLPRGRVEELEALTLAHPERREAQRALATEVTTLVHGDAAAAEALRAAAVLFSEEVADLDEPTLLDVFAEAPSTTLARSGLDDGLALAEVLADVGLVPSRSRARDTMAQGGAYVNNRRAGEEARLTRADLLHDRYIVLRRGKRDHHLLRFE
jgi:tyrosyl-tRNA synthetase